ncbi:PREDICTED: uncharacterized protein LOC109209049 [Nicotiana attenuata]|uniref:Uncharacterized protein n=1 Tax=Nicotiana attenuata TaxID=49451 RepID=A0A314KPS1_NICAT|nr:PREDICTED: uncharacterized protein LOC109209049 [Nicotiana attenuata]OIT31185.1 hypothetical protein A4A49_56449 [Nicotiana attenuata]
MAVIRNNILGNIPVNRAVHTGISGFVCSCGIIPLAWHYLNKTIHIPIYMIVIYFVLAMIGGIYFLFSGFNLVKEWIKAAVPEQEVAPPEQELPQFPGAPEP